ncbi:unnamed protein product [Urochloa decumbens]|uniref:U2A'/phosphoprotein 32 family A C-terminal domain-containing protein n=1 Tax=Urochloa decumbens TaxID=240449 RepID=A0ABC8X0Z6_9POAL
MLERPSHHFTSHRIPKPTPQTPNSPSISVRQGLARVRGSPPATTRAAAAGTAAMAVVGEDDAAWERAIAVATKNTSAPKTLTLDGAVKSSTGRLPSPALLERFAASLEELSVAGARLSSLAGMPRLPTLRRLSLPDNRLSGAAALAAVAEACGATLRHLDLGNNRFAAVEELEPLAKLVVEALDLYQCPVSKVKGYREKVFALIPSLKYLDGVDAEGNERLETDDEEDVEWEDEEEGEEGEDGEGEEGDGEEGDEEDGEDGEGGDDGEEEEEGDEEAEDEEDEADDDELDADEEDKENIESKTAGSSLTNKRKRDNDDGSSGDK